MTRSSASVPPQNIEAEASALGAMLVAEPALERVIDDARLDPADFYLDKHRLIFETIRTLYADGKPVDEISVSDALAQHGSIDEAGGRHYISELAATVPAAANAKHYAEIVQRAADMRRVGEGVQAAAEVFATRNGDRPEELHERIAELIQGSRPTAAQREPSSWLPSDLREALNGSGEPGPTILNRSDGRALLYDGRIAQAAGEPEAGKGWFAMHATAQLIEEGCAVLYVDFESTVLEVVQRLVSLGVEPAKILERFVYVHPHEPLTDGNRSDLDAALEAHPALVVLDGVTEALTIHGLDLADNADVARWLELLPRPAARTGAAVLMIDHVVKDKDSRGRYAIGAQHKLAGIDVAYSLEVIEAFGRGKEGLVKVKVNKDRPGHVRQYAEGDHIALMRLHSDAESGEVTVSLDPPDGVDEEGTFRPTRLMERVSRAVEANPGMGVRDVREIGGNASYLDTALKTLIEEGFVRTEQEGRRRAHYPVQPFRENPEEVF